MEAYVHGVSTRKVDDLVAALGIGCRDQQERGQPELRRARRGGGHLPRPTARAHELPVRLPRRDGAPRGAFWTAFLIRTIFAQPDALAVSEQLDEIVDKLEPCFPVAAAMLAEAKADVTAFGGFPVSHWRKIWSTHPLERVNKEIKRRTDVVGIVPNEAAITRLGRGGPARDP